MISASNEIALNGSREYGTVVSAASFTPACEAYGRSLESSSSGLPSTYFTGNATDTSGVFVKAQFTALAAGDVSSNPFRADGDEN